MKVRREQAGFSHTSFYLLPIFLASLLQSVLCSFYCCASSAASLPPPIPRRNLAINIDSEYLVFSASAMTPYELDAMCRVVVESARFMGVIE
jgi:hypothetical protein